VCDYAIAHGHTTAGERPDLSGLVLDQGGLTYRVSQRTVAEQRTELVPTGGRFLLPPRWGGSLRLDMWGAQKRVSRDVEEEKIVIGLDVHDEAGNLVSRRSFDGARSRAGDGLGQFCQFLDDHGRVPGPGEPSRESGLLLYDLSGNAELPLGSITRVAFGDLPPEDDAPSHEVDAGDVDDGGLSQARAKRAEARRAGRAVTAADLARALEVHHAALDSALREQDERAAKAVRSFLASAGRIHAPDGHVIWKRSGQHGGEDGASYESAVAVRDDGQIVLSVRGNMPEAAYEGVGPNDRMYRARVGYLPRVTLERETVSYDGVEITRGPGATYGLLPFYVSGVFGQPNWFYVLPLNDFQRHLESRIPGLVGQTTDWFVGALAQFLDRHDAVRAGPA
jgi:hypothetical protein